MQEVHLRRFEFALLKEIGVMPDFSEHIVTGNSPLYLSPEQGVFYEEDINNLNLNVGNDFFRIEPMLLQVLTTLNSETYGWSKVFQNKKCWLKVKSLLRFLLNGQLNSIELKSRRIMKEINHFLSENKRNKKELTISKLGKLNNYNQSFRRDKAMKLQNLIHLLLQEIYLTRYKKKQDKKINN